MKFLAKKHIPWCLYPPSFGAKILDNLHCLFENTESILEVSNSHSLGSTELGLFELFATISKDPFRFFSVIPMKNFDA